MTSTAIPSPKENLVVELRQYHADMLDADGGECAATALYREAADEIERLNAILSSSSEDVRREALEEAAKAIEAKHTNNVGMVHPMALDDAKAIRALSQKE